MTPLYFSDSLGECNSTAAALRSFLQQRLTPVIQGMDTVVYKTVVE